MNARQIGLIAGVLLAVFGMGIMAPPPVHADGAGKILLGVAAGLVIAGLLDSDRDHCHRGYVYAPAPCYVCGDRDDWHRHRHHECRDHDGHWDRR